MLGGAKDFFPHFLKLARKVFVRLLAANFLPQRSWRSFLDVTSKKEAFVCFSANVGRHLLSQATLGAIFARRFMDFAQIFRDFAQIFRNFSRIFDKSKLVEVRLHTPATPASYTAFSPTFPLALLRCVFLSWHPWVDAFQFLKAFGDFVCRSVLNPHMPFELVQQESVSCNASSGLECVSRAYGVIRPSEEPFYCLDYELRVLCCDCPEPKVQRKISCVREQPGYGQRWPLRGCKCRTVHPTVDKHINRPLQWRHRVFMLTLRSVS